MTNLRNVSGHLINRIMKAEAERTHAEFVNLMHPYFEIIPKAEIEISPDLDVDEARFLAKKGYFTISLGSNHANNYSLREILYLSKHNAAHETCHLAHLESLCRIHRTKNLYSKGHPKKWIATELVSELGAYLFFKQKGMESEYLFITEESGYDLNKVIFNIFGSLPIEQTSAILQSISSKSRFSEIMGFLESQGFNRREIKKNLLSI